MSPPGSEPESSDHVYGVVPPVAASVSEYVWPTVPSGRLVVVIDGGGTGAGATATESGCVSLCDGAVRHLGREGRSAGSGRRYR